MTLLCSAVICFTIGGAAVRAGGGPPPRNPPQSPPSVVVGFSQIRFYGVGNLFVHVLPTSNSVFVYFRSHKVSFCYELYALRKVGTHGYIRVVRGPALSIRCGIGFDFRVEHYRLGGLQMAFGFARMRATYVFSLMTLFLGMVVSYFTIELVVRNARLTLIGLAMRAGPFADNIRFRIACDRQAL